MKISPQNISFGEIIKIFILTAWLIFSASLMLMVYNNPIFSSGCNFWSNLIAIIGIIIATLIGWQIYSAMDWASKLERISRMETAVNEIKNEFSHDRFLNKANSHFIQAIMVHNDSNKNAQTNKDNYPNLLRLYLLAMDDYISAIEHSPIESCISNMQDVINHMKKNIPSSISSILKDDCDTAYKHITKRKSLLSLKYREQITQIWNDWNIITSNVKHSNPQKK